MRQAFIAMALYHPLMTALSFGEQMAPGELGNLVMAAKRGRQHLSER
jgi:hypothetical protein